MKKILKIAIIVIAFPFSIVACKKESDTTGTTSTSSSSTVSGKVADAQGNPIQNAKVTLEHTVWYDNYVFATTNNKGEYSTQLPDKPEGTWTAKAQIERSAYGQTYKFDLVPSSTSPVDKHNSAVRNFTWKLSGQRQGADGNYGAHVDLYAFGTDADLTKVKFILTPIENTLIDGSPAATIEKTAEDVAGTFMVSDIPIGRYKISAVYPGKTLLLQNRHGEGNAATSQDVVFGKVGTLGETEYNIEFWISE